MVGKKAGGSSTSISVIPALERLKQQDHQFEVKPHLKKKNPKIKNPEAGVGTQILILDRQKGCKLKAGLVYSEF